MKDTLTTSIVIAILGFAVYNAWKDSNEEHNHQEFFKSMQDFKLDTTMFMSRGGRNTSDMGERLCERLNMLEFHLEDDTKLTDCELVYK